MNAATKKITPIILSGGSGSRLWPISRRDRPKQFLPLDGKNSLLQDTIDRYRDKAVYNPPLVIASQEHRFLVAEQLRDRVGGEAALILEPVGRNTAPAIAVAALELCAQGQQDALMLVAPADHVIRNNQALQAAVQEATVYAQQGRFVTFGIVPDQPETGYGYIQTGAAAEPGPTAKHMLGFVEKPDLATATAYLESGDYYWNSGMFLFQAQRYLEALAEHRADIHQACVDAHQALSRDLDFLRLDEQQFAACPDESIDYAVMEHISDGIVVPLDADWSDIGSWRALAELRAVDGDGNAQQGDVALIDSTDCFVQAEHRLVTGIGLNNLVIVETPDALLIASKERSQDVKKLVELLKNQDRDEAHTHHRVYRPWGWYESISAGDRYQVKRIGVHPGGKLSLQMHHHRAEHWVVVKGTAKVTRGEQEIILSEDQSTYIPLGEKHRLENPGKTPLEIIEVQSGGYLGEDDIVRFEDVYGRSDQ